MASVRHVIPDIGENFQLDPAVIESKEMKLKRKSHIDEVDLYQSSQKELKFYVQAVMERHSGHELLGWRPHSMAKRRTTS